MSEELRTLAERCDEIDQMLFDDGCMALSATTEQARKEADAKIIDARVKLHALRVRLT